jgi:hypothetical protein
MKLEEFKTEITQFKKGVTSYQRLLRSYFDYPGDVGDLGSKISTIRSGLLKKYAQLELYIKAIGRNPRLHDGVWANLYSAYDNGLSEDIISRVGPSVDAMLTDLDYIDGKLGTLDEKDFKKLFSRNTQNVGSTNKWNYVNPFWLSWQLFVLAWDNKIISGIIIGLVVAYLVWKFGWYK